MRSLPRWLPLRIAQTGSRLRQRTPGILSVTRMPCYGQHRAWQNEEGRPNRVAHDPPASRRVEAGTWIDRVSGVYCKGVQHPRRAALSGPSAHTPFSWVAIAPSCAVWIIGCVWPSMPVSRSRLPSLEASDQVPAASNRSRDASGINSRVPQPWSQSRRLAIRPLAIRNSSLFLLCIFSIGPQTLAIVLSHPGRSLALPQSLGLIW